MLQNLWQVCLGDCSLRRSQRIVAPQCACQHCHRQARLGLSAQRERLQGAAACLFGKPRGSLATWPRRRLLKGPSSAAPSQALRH